MSDRADRPFQAERAGSASGPSSSADGAGTAFGGDRYDVAVAGGGAVGAVLACALADSGSSVLLADPPAGGGAHAPSPAVTASATNSPPPAFASQGTTDAPPLGAAGAEAGDFAPAESRDDRAGRAGRAGYAGDDPPAFAPRPLALSLASERVLASLGVWEALAGQATPIESIHVSEAGRFGAVRLDAAACGVVRFGSVVPADALGAALRDAVARRPAIHRSAGRIADARIHADGIVPRVVADAGGAGGARGSCFGGPAVPAAREAGKAGRAEKAEGTGRQGGTSFAFTASLLVVADGGRSELREALGIGATVRDYRQRAIASVVEARSPKEHTAFERFTPGGPVALLPMGGARYGLVWCCGGERADRLAGLSGSAFAEALDAVFAGRFGGFASAGERTVFGLRLARADATVAERVALIGNAANHLHPVAGQGFNLGMRDVACLAEVAAAGRREGCDPGDARVLERYRRWRAPDHTRAVRFTDTLVDVFCNRFSPAAPFRAPALVALDRVPPLKRALARRATGLAGKVPRLALGLPP